jgi:hypothetical protein
MFAVADGIARRFAPPKMKPILLLLVLFAADPWADGVRAYRHQDWATAWEHFEAAAAQPPVAPELNWNQALTALQLQKWDSCEQLAQALTSPQRRDFLLAEMSWRRSAREVQALAPSSLPLDQVAAKHVRALQSATRKAQRAQALWKSLAENRNSDPIDQVAVADANHQRASNKVEQLQKLLKQWQQQMAKKNGNDKPPPPPDKIDADAPPPPPEQQPKLTMQDQQDLLEKLQNRQKKKVVVRERNAGQGKPGGKDW